MLGRAQRWPGSLPSGCAEERRGKRDKGRSCLSATKWSEFCGPPLSPSTAGCPQRSGGTQTAGSPFLCLLSFGEAKESRSPAGAKSRPTASTKKQLQTRKPNPSSSQTTQPTNSFLKMRHRTSRREPNKASSISSPEVAPRSHGHMRPLHRLERKIPAPRNPEPSSQPRTIGPGVESAIRNHRNR